MSSDIALKVLGLNNKNISNIYISNSTIYANKDVDIKNANNIVLQNTKIITDKEIYYNNKVLEG
jgi:hypothetical protein